MTLFTMCPQVLINNSNKLVWNDKYFSKKDLIAINAIDI